MTQPNRNAPEISDIDAAPPLDDVDDVGHPRPQSTSDDTAIAPSVQPAPDAIARRCPLCHDAEKEETVIRAFKSALFEGKDPLEAAIAAGQAVDVSAADVIEHIGTHGAPIDGDLAYLAKVQRAGVLLKPMLGDPPMLLNFVTGVLTQSLMELGQYEAEAQQNGKQLSLKDRMQITRLRRELSEALVKIVQTVQHASAEQSKNAWRDQVTALLATVLQRMPVEVRAVAEPIVMETLEQLDEVEQQ